MEGQELNLFGLVLYLGVPVVLLIVQYFIGSAIENAHIRSLEAREAANSDFLITNLKTPPVQDAVGGRGDRQPALVAGEAVISSDFFKNWLFGLRNFFGGESKTFARIFDRARREATLRMIDEARRAGYKAICNVRYGSADIAGNAATNTSAKKTLKIASCIVTGTAY